MITSPDAACEAGGAGTGAALDGDVGTQIVSANRTLRRLRTRRFILGSFPKNADDEDAAQAMRKRWVMECQEPRRSVAQDLTGLHPASAGDLSGLRAPPLRRRVTSS